MESLESELLKVLLISKPSSIRTYQSPSGDLLRWDAWYPSGRHVIVALFQSAFSLTEIGIVNGSEVPTKPSSGSQTQPTLWEDLA
jgi:hypothetical protein